jgi:hypothetical protein
MGEKKHKRKAKKAARKPVNLTLDPHVRKAAEKLSDELGVKFVRLVDFALREELARHGIHIESEKVEAALEEMMQRARSTSDLH